MTCAATCSGVPPFVRLTLRSVQAFKSWNTVACFFQSRKLLAAATRTSPGQVLESGWMYAGTPARKFARLDDAKDALTALIVLQYCQYAQDFRVLEREAKAAAVALLSASRIC